MPIFVTTIKCKGGSLSKFSGKIHTHELVAVDTNFENRKRVYNRDYKRITRQFYNHLPGKCDCSIQLDRERCGRCGPREIKVKLITDSCYFVHAARYLLNIFQEEQVVAGGFTPSI